MHQRNFNHHNSTKITKFNLKENMKNNGKLQKLKEEFLREINTNENFEYCDDIDDFLDWLVGKIPAIAVKLN